jgi:hypothetical protein
MERNQDSSWLKNPLILALCGGCIFAGFLLGMLIFGSPWHLPPAWGDIPTWITGIATVGLLAGAIVTAIYAIRAFRAQAREISDQAEMLKVQSDQLAEQRKVNEKQIEVLALQASSPPPLTRLGLVRRALKPRLPGDELLPGGNRDRIRRIHQRDQREELRPGRCPRDRPRLDLVRVQAGISETVHTAEPDQVTRPVCLHS